MDLEHLALITKKFRTVLEKGDGREIDQNFLAVSMSKDL